MANESIKKAFQRFWEHTLNKIDDKADRTDLETLSSKVDEVEITANIQSDWNQNDETTVDYVKNRTHYTEMAETSTNVLEWDGNTEGLVAIEPGPGGGFYKVSDAILETFDLIGATITAATSDGDQTTSITENMVYENGSLIAAGEFALVAKEDNLEAGNWFFPEAGIYFTKIYFSEDLSEYAYVSKLELTSGATPFITTSEVVHKLDEKYLPDGLLTQSNLASDSEALKDIAELGLLEVMHHEGLVYYDATGKILSY